MSHNTLACPRIEIKGDKRKAIGYVFGSLVFVAIGCVLLLPNQPLLMRLIGAMSVAFFGLCACVWTRRFLNTQPLWVIDEQGILSADVNQLIQWQDISEVSIICFQKQEMICIQLFDEAAFVHRLHGWQKYIMILNHKIGYHGIYIPTSTTDYPIDTLAETLAHYRQHFSQH